jgi:hypothetical protein
VQNMAYVDILRPLPSSVHDPEIHRGTDQPKTRCATAKMAKPAKRDFTVLGMRAMLR